MVSNTIALPSTSRKGRSVASLLLAAGLVAGAPFPLSAFAADGSPEADPAATVSAPTAESVQEAGSTNKAEGADSARVNVRPLEHVTEVTTWEARPADLDSPVQSSAVSTPAAEPTSGSSSSLSEAAVEKGADLVGIKTATAPVREAVSELDGEGVSKMDAKALSEEAVVEQGVESSSPKSVIEDMRPDAEDGDDEVLPVVESVKKEVDLDPVDMDDNVPLVVESLTEDVVLDVDGAGKDDDSDEGCVLDYSSSDQSPDCTKPYTLGSPRQEGDVAGTDEAGGVSVFWPKLVIDGDVETWLGAPQRCELPYTIQRSIFEGTREHLDAAFGDGVLEFEERRGGKVRELEWIVTLPDPVPCAPSAAPGASGSEHQKPIDENVVVPDKKMSGAGGESAKVVRPSVVVRPASTPGAYHLTAKATPAPAATVSAAANRSAVTSTSLVPARGAAAVVTPAQTQRAAGLRLAETGAEVGVLASIGALMVAAGAGLLAARRRS